MSIEPTSPMTSTGSNPAEPATQHSTPTATSALAESAMTSPWAAFPTGQTDMDEGEGRGPWTYHILPEDMLKTELGRHAFAKKTGTADSVSMQPCAAPGETSQDRHVVHEWELQGGKWRLAAIFDGHAGHQLADHTVEVLPVLVRSALSTALEDTSLVEPANGESFVATISAVLSSTIAAYGKSIADEVVALFPSGVEEISNMSDEEISARINTEENLPKVVHGMKGTTALVSLVDPGCHNLWVASLGDCQAVLGTKGDQGWDIRVLSSTHNGAIPAEQARIMSEHPNEPEAMLNNRVLGGIAVTRALGDLEFLLPRIYTDRVFALCKIPFKVHSKLAVIMERNLTPPYLSYIPDIQHVCLSPSATTTSDTKTAGERFLIMCSDGLTDLHFVPGESESKLESSAERWMEVVSAASTIGGSSVDGGDEPNLALALLRDAIGGNDLDKLSRYLTVEMDHRWMDDTTIVVQRL